MSETCMQKKKIKIKSLSTLKIESNRTGQILTKTEKLQNKAKILLYFIFFCTLNNEIILRIKKKLTKSMQQIKKKNTKIHKIKTKLNEGKKLI